MLSFLRACFKTRSQTTPKEIKQIETNKAEIIKKDKPYTPDAAAIDNAIIKDILSLIFGYYSKNPYRKDLTFFDNIALPYATQLAKCILSVDHKQAVKLTQENPCLLQQTVKISNGLQGAIEAKVFNLAAMTGDIGLSNNDDGLLGKLAIAGGLSKQDIASLLHEIFSEEADVTSNKRKKVYQDALNNLVNSFSGIDPDVKNYTFENAIDMGGCNNLITQYRKNVSPKNNETITTGFIFDLETIYFAMMLYQNNKSSLGSLGSAFTTIFFLNGIGTLQSLASDHDRRLLSNEEIDKASSESKQSFSKIAPFDSNDYLHNYIGVLSNGSRNKVGMNRYQSPSRKIYNNYSLSFSENDLLSYKALIDLRKRKIAKWMDPSNKEEKYSGPSMKA